MTAPKQVVAQSNTQARTGTLSQGPRIAVTGKQNQLESHNVLVMHATLVPGLLTVIG